MAVVMNAMKNGNVYDVIHPLDDVAEAKCSLDGLGHMHMSGSVKLSLFALRGYLVTMAFLVTYRLITLAGVFGHHS
jgi:hypothetical protein